MRHQRGFTPWVSRALSRRKTPKKVFFAHSGRQRNFTDDNKNYDDGASGPNGWLFPAWPSSNYIAEV
jgi:hypothetical protein